MYVCMNNNWTLIDERYATRCAESSERKVGELCMYVCISISALSNVCMYVGMCWSVNMVTCWRCSLRKLKQIESTKVCTYIITYIHTYIWYIPYLNRWMIMCPYKQAFRYIRRFRLSSNPWKQRCRRLLFRYHLMHTYIHTYIHIRYFKWFPSLYLYREFLRSPEQLSTKRMDQMVDDMICMYVCLYCTLL